MRHLFSFTLAVLLALLASSCKKEDDNDLSVPYVPPYRIEGVVDFELHKRSMSAAEYQMPVSVQYGNGEQERVRLTLEDVPAGLITSIETSSGYPSFYTNVTFIDSGVAEGAYTIKLIAQGERSGRREYPFSVRVLPVLNCSAPIVGNYNGSAVCVGGGAYGISVQASPSVVNRIIFSNLNNNGLQLYADVECDPGGGGSSYVRYDIPSQTVGGVNYSGYGFYYPPNMSGNSSVALYIYQSNQGNCSYYFNR